MEPPTSAPIATAGPRPDAGSGTEALDDRDGSVRPTRAPRLRRAVVEGAVVTAAALVPLLVVFRPWGDRLRAPIAYAGDVLFYSVVAETATWWGGVARNPSVGAPHGFTTTDFPLGGDRLHLVLMRALRLVIDDPLTIVGTYYLLGFVLVALAAYVALRELAIARFAALAGAVLFAYLPYHFVRGPGHLTLSAYFGIPLAVVVLVRLAEGRPRLRGPLWRAPAQFVRDHDGRVAIAAAVLVATSNSYYAVFFLVVGGLLVVIRALRASTLRTSVGPVAALGVAAVALVLTLLPDLLATHELGPNPEVARRYAAETDFYGLRLSQLLLPSPGHRWEAMRTLGERAQRIGFAGEPTAPIGAAGLVGLIAICVWAARARRARLDTAAHVVAAPSEARSDLATRLVQVLVVAVLVATVGGLSMVLASAGFTQVRAWGRMGIVVGFVAIAGLGLLLEATRDRIARASRRWAPPLSAGVAVVVVALALVDQVVPASGPASVAAAATTAGAARDSDRAFVRDMAAALPRGSMVFELPYASFPESGPRNRAYDYDQLRLHLADTGTGLSWSYGAMRGREGDWQRSWSLQPLPTFLDGIAAARFAAVVVDRYAFTDTSYESTVTAELGAPAGTSRDARWIWYDLRPRRAELDARLGAASVDDIGRRVVRPLSVRVHGAAPLAEHARAVSDRATIRIHRFDGSTDPAVLRFHAAAASGGSLAITSAGGTRTIALTAGGTPLEVPVPLDGADATIELHTDAPNTAGPFDIAADVRATIADISVLDARLAELSADLLAPR